uniref:anoctamin-7-like n=1 Tax=Pristiophorus japonicus TaxID=55135 RepID=UPI00398EAC39
METAEGLPVIDYVLVYEKGKDHPCAKERMEFLSEVKKTGLSMDPDVTDKEENEMKENDENQQKGQREPNQIIKIYAPFKILSQAAEKMKLKMPLNIQSADIPTTGLLNLMKYLETDNEDNYFSAPYRHDKQHLFAGIDKTTTFFRPAVRSLIVHHILNDIHIPIENQKKKGERKEDTEMGSFLKSRNTEKDCEKEDGKIKQIPTLPYLLMKKAFQSAFTLHEGPKPKSDEEPSASSTQKNDLHNRWTELNNLWANTYRLQPLWKIRNYFGEKIAFYFALMEILILSLIVPALIGLAIFMYGLHQSVSCYNANSDVNTLLYGYNCSIVCSTPNMIFEMADKAVDLMRGKCDNVAERKRNIEQVLNRTCATEVHSDCIFQVPLDDIFNVIKSSFDNAATPLFGLFICLWGTIFLETWKRRNTELVYEWDVENYENDELVRPEFYGTEPDPITGEPEAVYSVSRQRLKLMLSLSVGIVMVGCVFISVLAVVIYKTWARLRVTTANSFESFLLTTLVSSLLNALSITVLRKVYKIIAVKMTDWENYRTQTDYNDALIIKLFAFQFANSYSSLFYIAFLRTNNEQFFTSLGLPGLEDNCGELNNCMTELSFQVLTLMITEPLSKFVRDAIVPWVMKLMNRCGSGKNKESLQKDCCAVDESILTEYNKPDLGDFTLEEYTEKVIQYGYQMLFAVSFPLGPFFFFLTILFDVRVDAKRLLQMYKRPVAHMAQDIGHWFTILDLINTVAVVTNGCLIAFTAEFGREKLFYEKLAILIVFEHIVFVVKYLLSTLIPDVPQHIQLAIKREKYEAQKKMELSAAAHYSQSATAVRRKPRTTGRGNEPEVALQCSTNLTPAEEEVLELTTVVELLAVGDRKRGTSQQLGDRITFHTATWHTIVTHGDVISAASEMSSCTPYTFLS